MNEFYDKIERLVQVRELIKQLQAEDKQLSHDIAHSMSNVAVPGTSTVKETTDKYVVSKTLRESWKVKDEEAAKAVIRSLGEEKRYIRETVDATRLSADIKSGIVDSKAFGTSVDLTATEAISVKPL